MTLALDNKETKLLLMGNEHRMESISFCRDGKKYVVEL